MHSEKGGREVRRGGVSLFWVGRPVIAFFWLRQGDFGGDASYGKEEKKGGTLFLPKKGGEKGPKKEKIKSTDLSMGKKGGCLRSPGQEGKKRAPLHRKRRDSPISDRSKGVFRAKRGNRPWGGGEEGLPKKTNKGTTPTILFMGKTRSEGKNYHGGELPHLDLAMGFPTKKGGERKKRKRGWDPRRKTRGKQAFVIEPSWFLPATWGENPFFGKKREERPL